jgi:hypothetical protein
MGKMTNSKHRARSGLLTLLGVSTLCAVGVFGARPLLAADDWDALSGAKTTGTAAASGTTSLLDTDENGNPIPKASPSPSPSLIDQMDSGDQTAEPKVTPAPTPAETAPGVDVEPPLPEAGANTDEAALSVPLPANPPLQQQFSEWDFAQVEAPTFLNAAIDEFNDRPLLITGNWSFKPHLSIGDYYDGNIFLKSQNEQSDFITRIAPGFTMRLGDTDSMFYLVGDYTAGFNYYAEHSNESTLDNDGRVQAQWSLPKTTIGLTMDVSSDTGQSVDITDRVRQELYFIGLTGHYDLSDKTSWDLSTDYTRSDYNGLISSQQPEAQAFFNYQYSPKTQIGVGAGAGLLIVPGTPKQTFEDGDVRATYRATGKLTLIAEGGMQFRQYGDGEGGSLTPVFILEGAWTPQTGTTLDLTARRSIYASAILNDQDYTATELDLTVTQRITDYVDVSLAGGYVNTNYTATATNVTATREDNYYYIRPAVEWKALSWLSVGIFYEYSQDLSQGGTANSFTRDRGGVDMAILF